MVKKEQLEVGKIYIVKDTTTSQSSNLNNKNHMYAYDKKTQINGVSGIEIAPNTELILTRNIHSVDGVMHVDFLMSGSPFIWSTPWESFRKHTSIKE